MNDFGQGDMSGSDIFYFRVKHVIAGVRPHRVLIPSFLLSVFQMVTAPPAPGLGMEQNPWKPPAGHEAATNNRPLFFLSTEIWVAWDHSVPWLVLTGTAESSSIPKLGVCGRMVADKVGLCPCQWRIRSPGGPQMGSPGTGQQRH